MPSYRKLQVWAIIISIVSVIYNGAEGGISIGFGAESSSRSLIFFGIQSAVEVASSLIVVWRFRNVAKPGEERGAVLDPRSLRFEKVSTLAIGSLLLTLAAATIATAIAVLVRHEEPDSSNASLIISASALVIMILVWLPKRYLARALNSSTMQGEATCSLSCIQITIVLFIGSLIYRVWRGGWWVDGATSIILGLLFGWEGLKMVKWARNPEFDGGCCGSCRPPVMPSVALEEGERYRDICECCEKKEACRTGDTCVCVDSATECCQPVKDTGEKCCTREIVFKKKENALTPSEGCKDACCSRLEQIAPAALPSCADDGDECCMKCPTEPSTDSPCGAEQARDSSGGRDNVHGKPQVPENKDTCCSDSAAEAPPPKSACCGRC
ncbi:hypothetical protein OE88DRAFT_888337 [Heliocybe sulcata]|uniref:Cation efflux protein transmembrane domain-containing protein n=1 Tax=Heliocybe sulcata TaxID=5364 RepID=A0A5C3MZ04_9AGAM|nr:hypothetical protein OE88DRAFT_888337 [Heliocybe sulcata]